MKIKLAKYIADFLAERGVEHVFTVTGGGAMHLNDAFGHHERLHCVYNHHEQASAIAAESYTRLTGRVAAVCVTSGPGGTNALTGVLGGWLDSVPMFVVSGQVKRETTIRSTSLPLRQLGDQEFDIVSCVRPMTKYAAMVWDPAEIAYQLEKAWYLCRNGRGGPVWLDVPLDVQAATIETEALRRFDEREVRDAEVPHYDGALSRPILDRIRQAKRPVLFVGSGVRLAGAQEEFVQLAEALRIPVVTAWNAHDLLWDDHPLYCGRPGTIGTRGGNFVVQNADCLLVLGSRLNIRQISYNYKDFAPDAYKIVVDIDRNELYKPTLRVDLPVWADLRDAIAGLRACGPESVQTPAHEAWLAWARKTDARYPAVLPAYYDDPDGLNPYVFVREFSKGWREDETVVCGNGSACVVTFQAAVVKRYTRLYANSGCAAMGYGFPAAIGACVAQGGRRVVCIDGDGSFQMNLQELQTVVYNRLNIKIIYLNNNGYHSIRQTQTNLFGSPLVGVCDGNGLSFPDAGRIAGAYGIPFMRVTTAAQIGPMLRFMEQEGPVFCEVVVDPAQNFAPKLSSRVLPDGRIVSPPIDDMFPFLDRAEYEENRWKE